MAELVPQDIRDRFDILGTEITDTAIEFALSQAIRETKQRVGLSVYADLVGATPSDELNAETISEVVSYLCVARLLKNKYLRFRRGGLVAQEQSQESAGMGSLNVTHRYLTPQEQIALADDLKKQAMDALQLAELETKAPTWTILNGNNTDGTSQTIPQKTSSEYNGI